MATLSFLLMLVLALSSLESFMASAFLQHHPSVDLKSPNKGLHRVEPSVPFGEKRIDGRLPKAAQNQRKSVASTQTGLFGLGFGEVVVILVVVGAVLGPENIGRIVKTSGATAKEFKEELKRVPEEFQKGMAEGEIEARARNAKRMKVVDDDDQK